jgi:hypothetical protein
LFWCLAQAGIAAAATYVVVSLIGSELTFVTAQSQTNIDHNLYDVRRLNDPILDVTALTAAKAAIEKIRSDASVVTLRVNDPKLLKSQDQWFKRDTIDAPELLELLKGEIGDDPATRLVIISSYRSEPVLKVTHGDYRGTGKVAGLGFYIDSLARFHRSDTGEKAQGFLAPFANFRIALVNPRSLAIEGQQTTAAGDTLSAAQAEDKDPWNVLTAQQKIVALQKLLAQEIARMTPMLLGEQSR